MNLAMIVGIAIILLAYAALRRVRSSKQDLFVDKARFISKEPGRVL